MIPPHGIWSKMQMHRACSCCKGMLATPSSEPGKLRQRAARQLAGEVWSPSPVHTGFALPWHGAAPPLLPIAPLQPR